MARPGEGVCGERRQLIVGDGLVGHGTLGLGRPRPEGHLVGGGSPGGVEGHGIVAPLARCQPVLHQACRGVERALTVCLGVPALEGVARAGQVGRRGQAEGGAVGNGQGVDRGARGGHLAAVRVEGDRVGVRREGGREGEGGRPEVAALEDLHDLVGQGLLAGQDLTRRVVDPAREVVAL